MTYNERRIELGDFTYDMITTLVREWQSTRGLEVDGKCGPATQKSIARSDKAVQKPNFWDSLRSLLSKDPYGKTPADDVEEEPKAETDEDVMSILAESVPNSSLEKIPSHKRHTSGGVYDVYGHAPKEKINSVNEMYHKAPLSTAKGLLGTWNSGSGKLYCHDLFAPHLRAALDKCRRLGVLDYIDKIGCYNHRTIRHKKGNPLSFHSFGIAGDINHPQNRSMHRKDQWTDKKRRSLAGPSNDAKYGPIPPPFSKGWLLLYPDGQPYLLIRAFLSCGFTWGGSWGRDKWIDWVEKYGIGWDDETIEWPSDWRKVRYVDSMHYELTKRR